MKRIIAFIILSIAYITTIHAGVIKGKVYDTTEMKPVALSMVTLIDAKDSIHISHTRTLQNGTFTFNNVDSGKYIVLITHAKYADYYDFVSISKEETKDMASVNLFERTKLLREVIIKNRNAIRIKGDTLEYLVDSFKVKDGAMVEDLLKVLPGIQVNKDGEITAQGEKVQKVLVDGEEFFGEDPTVATQNISSKVVDKIQVFDKKSDQAQFTGFDDENSEKTINLKLKDNMNKGSFGKLVLGAGIDNNPNAIWNNQAMFNRFKNKRQFSVYGTMSNTGKTGLGWEDKNKYASDGNSSMGMDEDGGFMFTGGGDDEDNSFDWGRNTTSAGLTNAWTGGIHFADKWNEAKQHLNTNYSFGHIHKNTTQRSYTENVLPTSTQNTADTSNVQSDKNTHRLSGKYEWNIDSSLAIVYNLSARQSETETANKYKNKNKRDDGNTLNEGANTNTNKSKAQTINNDITINKKLKKVGRTISLNASYKYYSNVGDGYLNSDNTFYSSPSVFFNKVVDQQKLSDNKSNTTGATLTYTEPLSKKIFLKTSYSININNVHQSKNTLEKIVSTANEYTKRIDSLSNDFLYNTLKHTLRADVKYQKKKWYVSAGLGFVNIYFKQIDKIKNNNYSYPRNNIFPSVRFNYKFDQFKRLTVTYSGNTEQPSIQQLQPLTDNTNPLEVYVGNPDLKMAYSQTMNANYFSYQALSGKSFWTGIWASNDINSISLNRVYDQFGKTTNRYENIKSSYNASMWAGFGRRIKGNWDTRVNVNGNYNYNPTIVNNIEGASKVLSFSTSPSISYNKEDKLNFSFEQGITYSYSQNSLTKARNISYFTYNPNVSITYYLPKKYEITTDVDYSYRPAVAPYNTAFTRTLWNANVSRKFLKNKQLEIRAQVNDLLNQNKGYDRTTTNNYNQEKFYNTLGRYYMLSAIWNFNTGPMSKQGPPPPKGMRGGMPRKGGGRRR